MKQLHIVLGADGAMGRAVVEALAAKELSLVNVGRTQKNEKDWRSADLLDAGQTNRAIEGATHVYLCVGLPYDAKVWAAQWPRVMQNVIDACAAVNAVLVFLDNIYMYGPAPLPVPFDETTSQRPPSKKGAVRKQIADTLQGAMDRGTVRGVIGRSADFYGQGARTSMLYASFLENMLAGKRPYSLGPLHMNHTYSYTLDNGRALVELALDQATYGQAWHLPVGSPITPQEAAEHFNRIIGTNLRPLVLPAILRKLMGLFVPIVREIDEMMYEYVDPYTMSDAKFRTHFPEFQITPYSEGLAVMADSFRAKS